MAEIDPVILELIARNDRYLAELRKTTRVAEQQMGRQERRVKRLETEMARSSRAIGGQFRRLAGIFATAFSARQVQQLADGYTRFTNQLQVAGLEGRALADTQEQLFGIAQRYGVELESLGTLFSRGAQVSKELGASQAELVQFTEGVAAALKIQGSSASQAQGALLQLSQALGSGTVRAEEFNSINEGALPILQAVARNLDAAGGSVARLKQLVIEGEVSSDQFFRAFLAGSKQLQQQAERASLTIGASFTALNNALGKYIGETDDALSATERISQAIILLSQNIDKVVTAIAVLGTVMLGRYVAGMAAGGVATRALVAHLSIATTSLAGTALAARSAGAALLAAFGGPVGIAVTALVLGIGYLVTRTGDAREATGRFKAGLEASNRITDKARELAEKLATARGKERDATLDALRVEKARAQQALISAKNDVIAARAALARANAVRAEQSQRQGFGRGIGGMGFDPGGASTAIAGIPAQQAAANLSASEQAVKNIEESLGQLNDIIAGASVGASVSAAAGTKAKKKTGPAAAEIAARHDDELLRLQQEELQARLALTDDVHARADLQNELLALEAEERRRQIRNDENFTDEQKAAQLAVIDALYGKAAEIDGNTIVVTPNDSPYSAAVRRELEERLAEQQRDLLAMRADAIGAEADLATSLQQRRYLESAALEIGQEIERSLLEQAIAQGRIADAAKARALLEQRHAAETERLRRENLSPGQRFLFDLEQVPGRMNEALENIEVAGLERLNDELADAIVGAKSLGEAFSNVAKQVIADLARIAIQKAVIGPLANALFGRLGGPLNLLAGTPFGGGRAVGGPVNSGTAYLVGERGPELLVPRAPGFVVPNQRIGAGSAGGVSVVRLELSGDIDARIQRVSGPVAVEVVRASAPAIVNASAAETVRRTSRPRM